MEGNNNEIRLDKENIEAVNSGSGEYTIQVEPKKKESGAGKFFLGVIAGAGGVLFGVLIVAIIILSVVPKGKRNTGLIDDTVISKVSYLKNIIDTMYYEDVSDEDLIEGIYRGIIASTGDRYSAYYSKEELEVSAGDWQGKFYGIGATLTLDPNTGYGLIDSTMPDSPAEKAGVKGGDIILKIDGEETFGMTLTEIVSRVRGEDGTEVVLTLERQGQEIEITVVRGEITETEVAYEKKDDIGYIVIVGYDDIAYGQFVEALDKAKADKVKGVILDLRGNPGGDISVASNMCREIMPESLIVYTEDKNGGRQDYFCDGSKYWDIPMVVLVNGGTASAAEIMTAALQDTQMATIVGTKTYGKGVYQNVLSLQDGSAVKVTAGRFYSPNGTCFHGVGITPDVVVELDVDAYKADKTDTQLDKAMEILKKQIEKQ